MAQRFEEVISLMKDGIYNKELLFDLIFRVHPDYSPNSCEWLIGTLLKEERISSLGYGYYKVSKKKFHAVDNSTNAKRIFSIAKEISPFSPVVLYHSRLLNNLIQMEDGPEVLIVEAEKNQAFGLYYEIHSRVSQNTMVNPTEHDLQLYFENKSIIVKKMFSKSPTNKDGSLPLEKLLVDLLVDPFIYNLYGGVDFTEAVKNLMKEYDLNFSTLLNYAKRRKGEEQIKQLLKESLPEKVITILPN